MSIGHEAGRQQAAQAGIAGRAPSFEEQLKAQATQTMASIGNAPIQEPIRVSLLRSGINLTAGDRDKEYGSPRVNLTCAGELKRVFHRYNLMSGRRLSSAEQEAIDMVITKISRVACGGEIKADTYIDGATYFAIAGEAAIEAESEGRLEYREAPTASRPAPGNI